MKDADGTTAVNGYAEEADVDGCARSPAGRGSRTSMEGTP